MLRIVQISRSDGGRAVALVDEPSLVLLQNVPSAFELARLAIRAGRSLREQIDALAHGARLNYDEVYAGAADWRLAPPIDHPEPSRCYVMGTGLTHKGSAQNRQSMHEAASGMPGGSSQLSDSMKMFQIGMEGGRPAAGQIGAAPEWFFKGTGEIIRAPNEPLRVPPHGFDGGEEAEIAGVYLVGDDGTPHRIGFAQANEFSDHVLEAQNYLYLAPSKLRDCSLGPELVIGAEFDDVPGRTTIERGGRVIWQAQQSSGEQRMCHSLANLEHHHFKHEAHRRPGDVHVHFFGADMFSFKDRLRLEDGDMMSISFAGFGRPLRNPLRAEAKSSLPVAVNAL